MRNKLLTAEEEIELDAFAKQIQQKHQDKPDCKLIAASKALAFTRLQRCDVVIVGYGYEWQIKTSITLLTCLRHENAEFKWQSNQKQLLVSWEGERVKCQIMFANLDRTDVLRGGKEVIVKAFTPSLLDTNLAKHYKMLEGRFYDRIY